MASLQFHLMRLVLRARRPFFNWDLSVDEFRAMVRRQARFFPPPADVEIRPVTAGGIPGEWFFPPGVSEGPVLLYLHGGAWVLGWNAMHRRMVAHLARAAGIRTLAIDYRVAPEHPFPAALDDCLAAYRWLLKEAGVPPRQLVIAGDSAGGNLTLTTLLSLRDAGDPLPAAAICIGASTDLEGTGASFHAIKDPVVTPAFVLRMRGLYAAGRDLKSPLLSPLHGDLRGLPPLLIQAGGGEMLLSDSERLAERARAAGVDVRLEVWPRLWHVWHLFAPTLPEARQAIERIGEFIRARLGLAATL